MTYSENFTLALGSSQTGLTLKAALKDTDGTINASARDISTGFTETGAGNYNWYYSSFDDSFRGSVVFYTGTLGVATDFSGVTVKAEATAGLTVDQIINHGDSNWTSLTASQVNQLSSIYVSTRGGITVNVSSPVASDGSTLNLIQGDDYLAEDSREITWTGDTADQWPDLTSGTLLFAIDRTSVSGEPTVTSPSGTQSFYAELTKTQTASLSQGAYKYDVQATLSSGNVVTLVRGSVNISKSYTD